MCGAVGDGHLDLEPTSPLFRQGWECLYLLAKACHLRVATSTLSIDGTTCAASTSSREAPAYVASRVEEGAPLPEVEVEGWLGGGRRRRRRRRRRRGVDEGPLVGEAVVAQVVQGLRGELFRELVGVMGV
jgi:hypothetical protein